MQGGDVRTVLDDFDPYIDEIERAELGDSRVLVKDEVYMPLHPSRGWIKCFVTSTQQDGFRLVVNIHSTILNAYNSRDNVWICIPSVECIWKEAGVASF